MRSDLKEWKALEKHAELYQDIHMRDLFEGDHKRFDKYNISHKSMLLDYSKQPISKETMDNLLALAKACDVEGWRNKMFSGEAINTTEERAVLHTALRSNDKAPIVIDGEDIVPNIQATLERMKEFSDNVRKAGEITHIVNIGIGGSDLGTSMIYQALKHFSNRDIELHFVSNIDATHLAEVLRLIDPKNTLFIITSKTFTTQETMTNAHSAKSWLQRTLSDVDVSKHFVAATQSTEKAKEFGIADDNIFPIWDWVGGRYSLWSAIGLPLCISLGFERFREMLDGAHSMDTHFVEADLKENIPIILALLGVWHRNFLGYEALSVVPYDQYLSLFPSYLQQLDMESNGKSVDRDNADIPYDTGPIIIGGTGTNAQHAYFQLLHQGTTIVPCDFIVPAKSHNPIDGHHTKLIANALAQSKAMMEGRRHDDPNKTFDGNRPSNTIIIDELTPFTLGMLLALYEQKIFVQGIIWNINSFDQCGVELGKILAHQVGEFFIQENEKSTTDASTTGLLNHIKTLR